MNRKKEIFRAWGKLALDIIDLQVCLSNITVIIIIKKNMIICVILQLKQKKPRKGGNTLTQSLKKN